MCVRIRNLSLLGLTVWEWIKEVISPIIDWFSGIFDWIGKGIDMILSGARVVTDFLGITDSNSKEESKANDTA